MRVKICGLKSVEQVAACAKAGADYIGLNFFPKSPRYVSADQARALCLAAPLGMCKVALVVDASDDLLDMLLADLPVDMLQLHGQESVDRVADIRARYGLPVMKVLGVADESDLPALSEHAQVADQLLVDAKPPKTAALPGGNGLMFDWRLIAGRRWTVPWMLAGGLTPANVAEAIRQTGASQVDVSSGVERAPGVKDSTKIAAFIRAAKGEN